MNRFVLIFSCLLLLTVINAEAGQNSDSTNSNLTVALLPLIYYTPETSWVFGAGIVANFNLGQSNQTYESQVAAGLAYSLFDQALSYSSWRIFTAENKDLFLGEIGWYRYVYFFYGIGNQVEESDQEVYDARYPRLRFSYARQLDPNFYLGLRYSFDNFKITKLAEGGLLEKGNFIGTDGGVISGLGPLFIYDSRDNQLYPTRGNYLESSFQQFGNYLGGNFMYSNLLLDARKLFPIKKDQVLATNLFAQFNSVGTPFFALGQLGGNKILRGLFEGKYRDRNVVALQGEYRWMFLPRWGAVAFASVGNIFSSENPFEFDQTKLAYGVGGRFKLSKKKKLNLRLDIARSPGENFQFYFTFGEAF
jgi:outer membrane protein assembly factor BamA